MTYQLDTVAARRADTRSAFISEMGAYTGIFTRAQDVTAPKGTRGIAFTFESDDGQKADLSIYTMKADGEKIMGFQTLMAMMTCLGLRGIREQSGQVKRYDRETQREVMENAMVYPDLTGKPIGLLLETEDYEKRDGGIGTSLRIVGAFRAADRFTSSEILDKAQTPEKLKKLIAGLKHRPLRGKATTAHAAAGHPAKSSLSPSFDDMEDDVPWK